MKTEPEQFKTVTVSVTQDDIAHGFPGSCRLCPIALALQRLFVPGIDVAIAFSGVQCFTSGQQESYVFSMPIEAKHFVVDYDAGDWMEPFSFPLDIPERLVPYLNPGLGLQEEEW